MGTLMKEWLFLQERYRLGLEWAKAAPDKDSGTNTGQGIPARVMVKPCVRFARGPGVSVFPDEKPDFARA